MGRKLFHSGNSTVVSIPPKVPQAVGLDTGDKVIVAADPDRRYLTIARRSKRTINGPSAA